MGARLVGDADESTELQRRHSVWLFPGVMLLHAVHVRALDPEWQTGNVIAALTLGEPLDVVPEAESVESSWRGSDVEQ